MSGAEPYVSICRSTSNCPMSSSRKRLSVAKDVPGRERLRARLEEELAEKVPSAISRVSLLELGPPVGWPVQYRVSGPDPHEVRAIAQRLAQMLGGNSQLKRINFDWIEPARTIRVHIDQDQARFWA